MFSQCRTSDDRPQLRRPLPLHDRPGPRPLLHARHPPPPEIQAGPLVRRDPLSRYPFSRSKYDTPSLSGSGGARDEADRVCVSIFRGLPVRHVATLVQMSGKGPKRTDFAIDACEYFSDDVCDASVGRKGKYKSIPEDSFNLGWLRMTSPGDRCVYRGRSQSDGRVGKKISTFLLRSIGVDRKVGERV